MGKKTIDEEVLWVSEKKFDEYLFALPPGDRWVYDMGLGLRNILFRDGWQMVPVVPITEAPSFTATNEPSTRDDRQASLLGKLNSFIALLPNSILLADLIRGEL